MRLVKSGSRNLLYKQNLLSTRPSTIQDDVELRKVGILLPSLGGGGFFSIIPSFLLGYFFCHRECDFARCNSIPTLVVDSFHQGARECPSSAVELPPLNNGFFYLFKARSGGVPRLAQQHLKSTKLR